MERFWKKLGRCLLRYRQDETAATAVEYGLIVGFISIAILGTVFAIGDDLESYFTVIHDYISSVL